MDLAKNQASTRVDEQPDAETQAAAEQPIGSIPPPKTSQDEVPSETVQPVREPPKVSEVSVIRRGIETPRGPLTRAATGQQEHFKPRIKQSSKQGMGL